MACNKINRIFPFTSWRPTYYYMVDYDNCAGLDWQNRIIEVLPHVKRAWIWDVLRDGYPKSHPLHDYIPSGVGEQEKVTWIPRCEKHHYYQPTNPKMKDWGWHFPEICTAVNSISAMIQIAVMLGYEEIYLLGCDLGYTHDRTQNHFIENYSDDPRDKSEMDNRNCLFAHTASRRDCPIPIYNATIGGQLEIHPRVNLTDVLKG